MGSSGMSVKNELAVEVDPKIAVVIDGLLFDAWLYFFDIIK